MGDDAALGALLPIRDRKRIEAGELRCGRVAMWAKAAQMGPGRDLLAAIRSGGVIAEMKRRSPSGGSLRTDIDPGQLGSAYQAAGAAALSVLTDGPGFGGSLADLGAVTSAVDVPVLRKDFVVDLVQIAQTRIAGADCVLLIVALLGGTGVLEAALAGAERAGLSTIVEVHDEDEVRIAVAVGATCIGVNNRDLRSLSSDLTTFGRLRPMIPAGVVCIAESGIRNSDDVRRLRAEGADAVLAGEALMLAADPAAMCAEFVDAMRS